MGEYVAFCDSDDYYLDKNAFSILYAEIEKSGCDVIQFAYNKKYNHLHKKVSSAKTPFFVDEQNFMQNEYPQLLCSFWNGAHLTGSLVDKLYNRRLLTSLPAFDRTENIFWGDDLIINLHLLKNCKSFKCIPNTFYCYRKLTGGTSRFSVRAIAGFGHDKKVSASIFRAI